MFIYPYKTGSESAKSLAYGLKAKRIRLENSKFKGSPDKIVINWGSSSMPDEVLKAKVLNKPEAVKIAANKLEFFRVAGEAVSVPPWTTDKEEAFKWIEEGRQVVGRQTLDGHSGQGIIFFNGLDDWEYPSYHKNIKLYTQYIPKKDEFRVHVMNGKVIDVQRKARKNGMDANYKIRSYSNGFVFVREGVEPNDKVLEAAVTAVGICGLDFGAVDVVWNNYRKAAYVLEVNTAPGLEGQTVQSYIEGLSDTVGLNRQDWNIEPDPVEVIINEVSGLELDF